MKHSYKCLKNTTNSKLNELKGIHTETHYNRISKTCGRHLAQWLDTSCDTCIPYWNDWVQDHLCSWFQIFVNVNPGREQGWLKKLSAPLVWEIWIEFHALGFHLAHLWLLQVFKEWALRWKMTLSLCVSVSLSLFHVK